MPNNLLSNYATEQEALAQLPEWLRSDPHAPVATSEVVMIDHGRIGRAVRSRREAIGLSLRGMAKWLSISPTHLSDLERGLKPWTSLRLDNATEVLGIMETAHRNQADE